MLEQERAKRKEAEEALAKELEDRAHEAASPVAPTEVKHDDSNQEVEKLKAIIEELERDKKRLNDRVKELEEKHKHEHEVQERQQQQIQKLQEQNQLEQRQHQLEQQQWQQQKQEQQELLEQVQLKTSNEAIQEAKKESQAAQPETHVREVTKPEAPEVPEAPEAPVTQEKPKAVQEQQPWQKVSVFSEWWSSHGRAIDSLGFRNGTIYWKTKMLQSNNTNNIGMRWVKRVKKRRPPFLPSQRHSPRSTHLLSYNR